VISEDLIAGRDRLQTTRKGDTRLAREGPRKEEKGESEEPAGISSGIDLFNALACQVHVTQASLVGYFDMFDLVSLKFPSIPSPEFHSHSVRSNHVRRSDDLVDRDDLSGASRAPIRQFRDASITVSLGLSTVHKSTTATSRSRFKWKSLQS
jgi:hypothetical protein